MWCDAVWTPGFGVDIAGAPIWKGTSWTKRAAPPWIRRFAAGWNSAESPSRNWCRCQLHCAGSLDIHRALRMHKISQEPEYPMDGLRHGVLYWLYFHIFIYFLGGWSQEEQAELQRNVQRKRSEGHSSEAVKVWPITEGWYLRLSNWENYKIVGTNWR